MTTKLAILSAAAVAIILLAAGGNEAFAARSGSASNGGNNSGPGSAGPGIHAPITHRAPVLVRAWTPRRRRELPNNCEFQKWRHWDGEAYYYRVRTFCKKL